MLGRTTTPLRARLLAAAALVAVPAVVLATPGTAEAATTKNRADAAAGWLGRQLDDDHLITTTFDGQSYPDYGLTGDTVLALDAAKVGKAAARRATRALKAHVLDYTGGGDATESYAGAYAKLVVVAAAQGVDPAAFGTGPRKDLLAGLLALECGTRTRTDCAATAAGRFSDRSAYGDFSNTIGQSLALIGLERATKRGASHQSVGYLLGQQCPNGSFPEVFDGATCTGSADSTGFAVQALVNVGTPAAVAAATDAGRWLKKRQHANGSLSGNGSRNANSTALAAQAFTALGRGKAAARARHFLRTLQVGCGAKAGVRGQVRYDRDASGDPVRATSQAVPALARATLADIGTDGSSRRLPRLAC
ncbi:MAG: prenyltransferase/squalene oxidase repeat-containing protein [Sporichthyaceae bacterium]